MKMKWLAVFLALALIAYLPAQEAGLPEWDIDSLFEEHPESGSDSSETTSGTTVTVRELIRQRGFNFDLSFEFVGGIAPGWHEVPWAPVDDKGFYFERLLKMRTSFTIDAQISSVFRVRSTINYEIPNFAFTLGDVFFDYILFDRVFFRGGKYNLSWGISPNYNFTNLLARIPYNPDNPNDDRFRNDSFILKADIPIGVGGLQVLALTRANLLSSGVADANFIKKEDLAYGAKYNLAFRWADFDMGVYYQKGMPFRGFLSVKTTLWNTELYSEGMGAINTEQPSDISGAVSLGFSRDFFDNKFSINSELFYNAEKDARWYRPESTVQDAEVYPFVDGLNGAVNLVYRFKDKWNVRLFTQLRYAIISPDGLLQNSAQLIPGFRISPWSHIELYCAVPMTFGSADGYYYKNTLRMDTSSNPNRPIPFSVILMLSLSGGVQFSHYY